MRYSQQAECAVKAGSCVWGHAQAMHPVQAVCMPMQGHSYGVYNYFFVSSVAFSPDGKLLATGSSDNTARLWDLATGQAVATMEVGHGEGWGGAH